MFVTQEDCKRRQAVVTRCKALLALHIPPPAAPSTWDERRSTHSRNVSANQRTEVLLIPTAKFVFQEPLVEH